VIFLVNLAKNANIFNKNLSSNWKSLRLRKSTRDYLERLSTRNFINKVRYIILFGSEARGSAQLTSDIDIAVISDEPLTREERVDINFPDDEANLTPANSRFVFSLTDYLNTSNKFDVNYNIREEGIIIYERK